jgi:hypothetical protein
LLLRARVIVRLLKRLRLQRLNNQAADPVAVRMFAAPSMSFATRLDGSRISAATCVQVRPSRSDGAY